MLNFPSGSLEFDAVLNELDRILASGLAEEIDYVFPYALFLSGNSAEAFARYHAVSERCAIHQRRLKVILETGAFPSVDLIRALSMQLIEAGCGFLKTSTGKIAVGATHEAVLAISTAIRESAAPCGIKVSGGVRTDEQALAYIHLVEGILCREADPSWFRLGRSALR